MTSIVASIELILKNVWKSCVRF